MQTVAIGLQTIGELASLPGQVAGATAQLPLARPAPCVQRSHSADGATALAHLPKGHFGTIRTFEEADIPRVCELFAKTFRTGKIRDYATLSRCIHETYFSSPAYRAETSSFVHTGADGIVDGFMGVIPVSYKLGEMRVTAGILSAFMADHPKASPRIGAALARAALARPFDLLFTDTANRAGLDMSRAARFTPMPHQSLEWFKVLRPASMGVHMLRKRFRFVANLLSPAASLSDRLLESLSGQKQVCLKRDGGVSNHRITMAAFVAGAPAYLDGYSLRPEWSERELVWLTAQASLQTKNGALEFHEVRDRGGSRAGLYLLYVRRGGVAYALQVLAKAGREEMVLSCLLGRAAEAGAIAVRGAATREAMTGLLRCTGVLFHHVMTTVVWSRHPKVAAAIKAGDIFIGGLAGETWARVVAEEF